MNKLKCRLLVILFLVLFVLISTSACATSKNSANVDMLSELSNWIIDKVIENYNEGDISEFDITIERIYFGSFSQDDAEEILVLCKILNMPHVAGLDKTVAILLTSDSLEVVAYEEFSADKVVINYIQSSKGKDKIVILETTTYQGISTQEVQLMDVQDCQWVEIPIEALKALDDECFYIIGDGLIIVTSKEQLTTPEDVVAVLSWNNETEQYVLKYK